MKYFKYFSQILMVISMCSLLLFSHNVLAGVVGGTPSEPLLGHSCTPKGGSFLGLDPWYQYLKSDFSYTYNTNGTLNCGFHINLMINFTCSDKNKINSVVIAGTKEKCSAADIANNRVISGVSQSSLGTVWLIGLAIFEDLLRVAGMAAVAFVIYGGFRYTTSQGSPEQTGAALGTILHALIGLAIAIIAATSVAFIAKQF